MWLKADKVYSLMRMARHPTEEMGGVSRAHWNLKDHSLKRLAVNRAVFDKVKRVLLYTTIDKF